MTNWHHQSVKNCLQALNVDIHGLTTKQALERSIQYGKNEIPINRKHSLLKRWMEQFHNVLIYILIIAAVFTYFLNHKLDTVVILSVVFLNAIIGFIQEGRAIKAIEALRKMLSSQAQVLRDHKRVQIPMSDLVPGDIVLFKSGNKVPADIRIIESKNLQVDEAILTGESLPIEKNVTSVASNTILSERTSMLYNGTLVTYGTGKGVVVGIGTNSEIGRISGLMTHEKSLQTPLLKQIEIFGHWLALFIIGFATVIFIFGIWVRNYPLAEMFMAAVAIAVAIIPEGLPAIMTIILAVGVTRMAKRNAIIKRLASVEVLSCVNVICTDKTGTLTKNELTVKEIITGHHYFKVTGSGYNDKGCITELDHKVDSHTYFDLDMLLQVAVICTESEMIQTDEHWQLYGSPMDGALLSLGLKSQINHQQLLKSTTVLDVIPFESSCKYMASLIETAHEQLIFIKGAPEKILSHSLFQLNDEHSEDIVTHEWVEKISLLANQGMRVLALAYKKPADNLKSLAHHDVTHGLTILGLVGIMDPPRPEVIHSIAQCHRAGINIKMITGDHVLTAKAVAKKIGIDDSQALTGEQLDAMSDEELLNQINGINIFARTVPEHKVRLIEALQSQNKIVAMTGDGVNDAPALQYADIGIAMGIKGTEVTREAAEIVLADDNFSSIEQAVREGRNVYNNLKKALLFILPNDGGEGLSIFFAILMGYTLPITPVQILWVNLVTAITLALALSFEPAEHHLMSAKPRQPDEPLFSALLIWRIVFVSGLFVVSMFGLFMYTTQHGMGLDEARTMVVNVLVLLEVVYLINCRYIFNSVLNVKGIFGSKPVLIAIAIVMMLQMAFTYLPLMQFFFKTVALDMAQWALLISIAVAVFLLIELEKKIVKTLYHI